MQDLLKTPVEQRTPEWERQFLEILLKKKVKVLGEEPVAGPDQFPYLLVETSEEEEPVTKIIQWLNEKGIGLVINPHTQPYPDMVLTYGMIHGLSSRGDIWNQPYSENFIAGDPSEEFLSLSARSVLKQFLIDQGILQPRFQLVSTSNGMDFCFSLESLGEPPAKEHEGVAEALSWFLPPNFAVTLASESKMKGFVAI